MPDWLVYRYLIKVSLVPKQIVYQAGFTAADPKKNVVDVGANRGIATYYMSLRFPHVDTFEPNLDLQDFLEKVIPSNCTLHRCGLSDQLGETELSLIMESGVPIHGRGKILSVPDPSHSFLVQKIKLETLDSQGLKNIGLIKIDVEGHEDKVLRGGIKTIKENKPVLIIEIEKRHTNTPVRNTIQFIESLGYTGFFFENDVRRSTNDFEEKMQDPGYPYYINDFLFLPK